MRVQVEHMIIQLQRNIRGNTEKGEKTLQDNPDMILEITLNSQIKLKVYQSTIVTASNIIQHKETQTETHKDHPIMQKRSLRKNIHSGLGKEVYLLLFSFFLFFFGGGG